MQSPHPLPLEFLLMLGYAVMLAVVALLLELVARHAHRRSLETATVGFTYHRERDIWRCPHDQHLFPIFSDHAKGVVVYRAPASACNSCPSKAACTDSDNGREIERRIPSGLEFGMQRFHRVMSITLLILASLILMVEVFHAPGLLSRLAALVLFLLFCLVIRHLASDLRPASANTEPVPGPKTFTGPPGFRSAHLPWKRNRV